MIRIKITITNIYLKELAHFQDYISHTFYEVFVFVNLLAIENKDNYIDMHRIPFFKIYFKNISVMQKCSNSTKKTKLACGDTMTNMCH